MRRLVFATAVAVVCGLLVPCVSHAATAECVKGRDGVVLCSGSDGGLTPGRHSQSSSSGKVKSVTINLPDLPPDPDPTFMTMCNNPDAPSAITYDGSCAPLPPGTVIPAGPTPQQQAQMWVTNFFQRVPMARPQPKMSSPNGVTGGIHSLDLQMDDEAVYTATTPQGPLTLHAFAKSYVDWGDGKWVSYNSTGAPYPDSEMEHTWDNKGIYTIRVVVSWTAEWVIGNQFSGTVGGVATTANIPNWEVHQIRAVITSG